LLVSELVTDAVKHAAKERLRLTVYEAAPDLIRVEVSDGTRDLSRRQVPDRNATGGRGLFLIEAMAKAWGVGAPARREMRLDRVGLQHANDFLTAACG
jgi:serine/threonine-protein kinase RsbW